MFVATASLRSRVWLRLPTALGSVVQGGVSRSAAPRAHSGYASLVRIRVPWRKLIRISYADTFFGK